MKPDSWNCVLNNSKVKTILSRQTILSLCSKSTVYCYDTARWKISIDSWKRPITVWNTSLQLSHIKDWTKVNLHRTSWKTTKYRLERTTKYSWTMRILIIDPVTSSIRATLITCRIRNNMTFLHFMRSRENWKSRDFFSMNMPNKYVVRIMVFVKITIDGTLFFRIPLINDFMPVTFYGYNM